MNTNLKAVLVALVVVLSLPLTGFAQMQTLSDSQMEQVTAQKGINISVQDVGIDMTAQNLYYGDEDGIEGSSEAGYISLTGIDFQGDLQTSSPIEIDVGLKTIDNIDELASLNIDLQDYVLNIKELKIDAVRVGSEPGQGKSFGSLGIKNMRTQVTGKVQIRSI